MKVLKKELLYIFSAISTTIKLRIDVRSARMYVSMQGSLTSDFD